MSYPNDSNIILEISPKVLENPQKEGQSAAKPLKEDSDYLIYSNGKLFSKKANRFLAGKIDNAGYRTYCLSVYNPLTSKIGKMFYAHRLVAEYFIPNPENLPYVHHKDENKLNNDVSNLEWTTPSNNSKEHLKMHENCRKGIKAHYNLENLPDEKWMIVQENPMYSVSNMGRIVNNRTNRLLKLDLNNAYTRVSFNDRKHYSVHRLVYCTFNNDYDLEGYVIDHIDANPRNNKLSNLQKITSSENNKRRFNKGRFNDQSTADVGSSESKEETPS